VKTGVKRDGPTDLTLAKVDSVTVEKLLILNADSTS